MANWKKLSNNQKISPDIFDNATHKKNLQTIGMLNKLLDDVQSTTYGISQDEKLSTLDDQFSKIMQSEISRAVDKGSSSTTEFIGKLWQEENGRNNSFNKDIEQMINGTDGEIEAYLSDQYKNRLIKQNDIHEVSSQLSELKEAILITRDSIVTADITDGKISRQITFNDRVNDSSAKTNGLMDAVETMEKTYKLHNKIKNHIIPKTLEYGEYYAYVIPYGDMFKQFYDSKDMMVSGQDNAYAGAPSSTLNNTSINESTILESCDGNDEKLMIESIMESLPEPPENMSESTYKKEIRSDIESVMKNITVNNKPVPLCVLDEGVEAISEFCESYGYTTEANKVSYDTLFKDVVKEVDGQGITAVDTKKRSVNFKEYKECYMKLIDPTRIIPVKVMDTTVGYYYIQDQDITPLTGVLTSTVYYTRYDDNRKERTLIDTISGQIVKSFDKKFLRKNQQFKELIVNALTYYKLNEKRIKFQFIPKEYIIEFKINEDLDGNGTSMIEPALFYAKLYLMILLFKVLTILKDSNDTKINYIKQSGIDKNYMNKINEIARKKQQRTINMTDLMCYTSMISKVGAGHEIYIPVGRSGERGIETEVISGQDVQLNTELMEMLKKQMITAVGVPEVLMNYINEADFAKTLELANTRYQGRIVNYQLDFNRPLTELYRRLMRGSTNIDEQVINSCEYKLNPPKASSVQVTTDILQNYSSYQEWLSNMFLGSDYSNDPDKVMIANEFAKKVARDTLGMIDFDKMNEFLQDATLEVKSKKLNPANKGNEDGQNGEY